jgi:hypothetical protein
MEVKKMALKSNGNKDLGAETKYLKYWRRIKLFEGCCSGQIMHVLHKKGDEHTQLVL